MIYPFTLTPYAIVTLDGFFAKTNKAQGMNHMASKMMHSYQNLHKQLSSCYMKDIPSNMKLVSKRIFSVLPAAAKIVFSNDRYNSLSPKAAEGLRRGCQEKFIVEGINMKRAVN